jgi:hypothetical protein
MNIRVHRQQSFARIRFLKAKQCQFQFPLSLTMKRKLVYVLDVGVLFQSYILICFDVVLGVLEDEEFGEEF